MTRRRTMLATALVALVAAPTAPAQKVSDTVARALEKSPQVRLARARVAQAEAELDVVRRDVARQAMELLNERRTLELEVEAAESSFAYAKALYKKSMVSQAELRESELKIVSARARLESCELQIRFLTSDGPSREEPDRTERRRRARPRPVSPGDRPDWREALAHEVTIDGGRRSLQELVALLGETAGTGLRIIADNSAFSEEDMKKPELLPNVGTMSLGDALQAIADQTDLVFVWRPYGLLVTETGEAGRFPNAATIR